MSELSLATATRLLRDRGAQRVYAKLLSPNDNSKNQIYLGGDFEVLQIIPGGEPVPSTSGTHRVPIFKSAVALSWLDDEGRAFTAPGAQLILYPQYPEVRLSGFLRGAAWAPSDVLTVRDRGRVLLLGVAPNGRVLGIAAPAGAPMARELRQRTRQADEGVLVDLNFADGAGGEDSKAILLQRLCEISGKGWIEAWRLKPDGSRAPCESSNCVGATLESELGILANGRSEPDFMGWEVKAATVSRLDRPRLGAITLMTPEPTGGYYRDVSVAEFVRKYGYADRRGRLNRLNFGGIHRFGQRHPTTGLELIAAGFDSDSETIVRSDGELQLVAQSGEIAASWSFAGLLAHWNRKHAKAAYVPSVKRSSAAKAYAYGKHVFLASNTDFLAFLSGVASGVVYYDPGIKLVRGASGWITKRRSQWRIAGSSLARLYRRFEVNDACDADQRRPR